MSIGFHFFHGYTDLSADHQATFRTFIENFFRGLSTSNRYTLIPRGIYFVEHTTLVEKRFDEDGEEYFYTVGENVERIHLNDSKSMHRQWRDEEFNESKALEWETTKYLRFEYEHLAAYDEEPGRLNWLHVIKNGEEWY